MTYKIIDGEKTLFLEDSHTTVLQGVKDRKSFREIAKELGCSVGTVQLRMRDLEILHMVMIPKEVKARARTLTPRGEHYLKTYLAMEEQWKQFRMK